MAKYIAWNTYGNDFEFFKTEEEAIKFCDEEIEMAKEDACEYGWSDHVEGGGIGYAKIVAESTLVVTDSRDNYPCLTDKYSNAECSSCQSHPSCKGTEEWDYEVFDEISECVLQKKEDSND